MLRFFHCLNQPAKIGKISPNLADAAWPLLANLAVLCRLSFAFGCTRAGRMLPRSIAEGRFAKQFDKEGNPSSTLLAAQQDRLENWHMLQELAGIK